MKVALVFHGLSEGKNQKGIYSNITENSFKNIKDNMLNKCSYDTYFHTWGNEKKESIINIIKPKKYIFENADEFKQSILVKLEKINKYLKKDISIFGTNIEYLYSIFSRFYSLYKSIQLVDKSENYDLIIISRFDLYITKKLYINKLKFKTDRMYLNRFSNYNKLNGLNEGVLDDVPNKYTQEILKYGFHDYFFIADKNTVIEFSKLYLFLEEYFSANSNLYNTPWPRISGHSICSHHISQQNIKYKYTIFEEKVHFCLIRDIQVNSESNTLKQCDLLTTKNKFTDAINLLLDYQKNKPSANIYIRLGYLNITAINDLDKGLYYYKKSLTTMKNVSAYNNIIRIYMFLNNKTEAKKYCEECTRDFNSVYVKEVYNQLK